MKIIERTHNIITGEITEIERDPTAEEIAQAEAAKKQYEADLAHAAAKAALLEKLGITEQEAKLLLG